MIRSVSATHNYECNSPYLGHISEESIVVVFRNPVRVQHDLEIVHQPDMMTVTTVGEDSSGTVD